MFKNKTVVVGVTGGIAAYKTCELVSRLKKASAEVRVIMTKNAREFVSPLTFETLSGYPVATDTFQEKREWEVMHVALAKKADVFVVAPATANIIGKYANGIADDMLSTTLMATKAPILFAPAMNTGMITSDACVCNTETLKKRGVKFIYGDDGLLACGDVGKGRMAEPEKIFDAIADILLLKRDYEGKTVLITAGATIEKIDGVRFITNFSSGKMGCEIAKNARDRGAKVILVLGRHTAEVPVGATVINVDTTQEMYDAVMDNLAKADLIIKAAAPCDYAPQKYSPQKIKTQSLVVEFKKNPDIAAAVGKQKGKKVLVAFAAETENLIANAQKKLVAKNADFIVANDVTQEGAGFNVDTDIISLVDKDGAENFGKMTKTECAKVILDKAAGLIK